MKCTIVCTVLFWHGQLKLIQSSNCLQFAYQTVQCNHSSTDLIQVLPVQAAIYSHAGVAVYFNTEGMCCWATGKQCEACIHSLLSVDVLEGRITVTVMSAS